MQFLDGGFGWWLSDEWPTALLADEEDDASDGWRDGGSGGGGDGRTGCLPLEVVEDEEEHDSETGSGCKGLLGAGVPPASPPASHSLLQLLRSPESEPVSARAALLREEAAARTLHARVDELRAGASELRRYAQSLRAEMQVSDDEGEDNAPPSRREGLSGAVLPPASPVPPPALPPVSLRLWQLLRTPESEPVAVSAGFLREAADARALKERVDELRAGASELRLHVQDLRAQMQDSETHARVLTAQARHLAEELRGVQHLDALLVWLHWPPPDVAVAALPDDEGGCDDGVSRRSHEGAPQALATTPSSPRRRVYTV